MHIRPCACTHTRARTRRRTCTCTCACTDAHARLVDEEDGTANLALHRLHLDWVRGRGRVRVRARTRHGSALRPRKAQLRVRADCRVANAWLHRYRGWQPEGFEHGGVSGGISERRGFQAHLVAVGPVQRLLRESTQVSDCWQRERYKRHPRLKRRRGLGKRRRHMSYMSYMSAISATWDAGGWGATCEPGSRPSPVTAGTSDRTAWMVKGGDLGGFAGG